MVHTTFKLDLTILYANSGEGDSQHGTCLGRAAGQEGAHDRIHGLGAAQVQSLFHTARILESLSLTAFTLMILVGMCYPGGLQNIWDDGCSRCHSDQSV